MIVLLPVEKISTKMSYTFRKEEFDVNYCTLVRTETGRDTKRYYYKVYVPYEELPTKTKDLLLVEPWLLYEHHGTNGIISCNVIRPLNKKFKPPKEGWNKYGIWENKEYTKVVLK